MTTPEQTIARLEAELSDARYLIEILELEKTVYARKLKCRGKRIDLLCRQLKRLRKEAKVE